MRTQSLLEFFVRERRGAKKAKCVWEGIRALSAQDETKCGNAEIRGDSSRQTRTLAIQLFLKEIRRRY
jgi:hypothetical protein